MLCVSKYGRFFNSDEIDEFNAMELEELGIRVYERRGPLRRCYDDI